MMGVFDSGAGGLCAFRILRSLLPREDLVFLRDEKNCPYGKKSREEIAAIAEKNISLLEKMGCERVLIACCTASTVFDDLSTEAQAVAIPIVAPTLAKAEALSRSGKIGVIATEATIRSHAFHSNTHTIYEAAAQRLVDIVEGGERDGAATEGTQEYLCSLLAPIVSAGVDTLILGCTHFHALRNEIEKILNQNGQRIITVSSAEVGALAAASIANSARNSGRTVYI